MYVSSSLTEVPTEVLVRPPVVSFLPPMIFPHKSQASDLSSETLTHQRSQCTSSELKEDSGKDDNWTHPQQSQDRRAWLKHASGTCEPSTAARRWDERCALMRSGPRQTDLSEVTGTSYSCDCWASSEPFVCRLSPEKPPPNWQMLIELPNGPSLQDVTGRGV